MGVGPTDESQFRFGFRRKAPFYEVAPPSGCIDPNIQFMSYKDLRDNLRDGGYITGTALFNIFALIIIIYRYVTYVLINQYLIKYSKNNLYFKLETVNLK